MKSIIYHKGYNLEKLNNYLKEKQENGKNFKNLIWIILDIVSENIGKINRDDLFEILNKFKKYDISYFNNVLEKNLEKIEEKEGVLYVK
ncbi:hypothetical protein HG442_000780 [Candidatus Gracilibacteria bacterium]|nr:hypothetical protein [Candidatus Gracilibacteria bacterium]